MGNLFKGKYATVVAIFSVSIALQFFLPSTENTTFQNLVPEDKFKKEPGWYEQFHLMKQDENGKIPSGLYKQWYASMVSRPLSKQDTVEMFANVTNIGPTNVGGRTRAVLINKNNPNHILAGSISGGLWQSFNRGKSWLITDDFSSNLNVSSITQNPFNTNIIYYGTGESANNYDATLGDGIYKSTDAGKTFKQLPATKIPAFEYIWEIKHSLTDSNTFYVATKSAGLYRTKNGGESFERIYTTSAPIHEIEVFPNGKIMIAISGAGIFSSASGEPGSFVKAVSGLPTSGFTRISLAYCDSFSNVIYAQFGKSSGDGLIGLYRSDDSGSTWIQKGTQATNMSRIGYQFVWYCFTLGVKPNNPNSIISASVTAGFSNDGGVTWQTVKESHADNHIIVPDPATPEKFFLGNDGGIYSYNWPTISTGFENLNTGYISTQFHTGSFFPTGIDIIGGTQDNGTHMTTNGADKFKKLYGGDGSFAQINQQNPVIGYASTQNGNILKSSNIKSSNPSFSRVAGSMNDANGNIADGAWFINPFEINLNNGDELYFVTRRKVYRTSDGAQSWVPIMDPVSTSFSPYAVGISNETNPTVYVGGVNALFRRIDNASTAVAGTEVDLRNSVPLAVKPYFIASIKVHPRDPSVAYVGFSNYITVPRIYKVTQANTATPVWTSITGDLPNRLPVNWVEADPNNPDSVLFAATDFGLYYTVNGGKNWLKEMRVPNVVVAMIKLRASDGNLFIFTHGRGVWQAQLTDQSWQTSVSKNKAESNNISIYPNPAQDFIKFDIKGIEKNNERYQAQVYNLEGKLMIDQVLNSSYSPKLEVNSLPAGTYIVKLINGNKSFTTKLLKN